MSTNERIHTVTVSGSAAANLRQEIDSGGHRLVADEPIDQGGGDAGPGPYEYLLAALGACTSMTLRLYAKRKGWPLEDVKVTLTHQKIHALDCEDCETREGKVDSIQRHIEVTGALDSEQKQRLKDIADKCPVHRTLTSEIKIRTTLA